MLRQNTLVRALALATLSYAQSSTQSQEVVSVLAIGGAGDQQNLFASVVDNDATATTLKIGCNQPTNAEATESVLCNLFSGFDVVVGPSTFAAGYEYNSGTMTITCAVTGTTTASCKQTVIRPAADMDPNAGDGGGATATDGGDEEIFSTVSGTDTGLVTEALETTLAGSDMTYYPVTITAGSLKSGGEGGGSGTTTSGTGSAAASGSESASASGGSGSSGAGQLMIEVIGVAAAGSIALLMVML